MSHILALVPRRAAGARSPVRPDQWQATASGRPLARSVARAALGQRSPRPHRRRTGLVRRTILMGWPTRGRSSDRLRTGGTPRNGPAPRGRRRSCPPGMCRCRAAPQAACSREPLRANSAARAGSPVVPVGGPVPCAPWAAPRWSHLGRYRPRPALGRAQALWVALAAVVRLGCSAARAPATS